MRTILRCGIIALGLSFAAPALAACTAPAAPAGDGIHFLLGIQPSDGLLDVWCRVQALRGQYKVDIFFPEVGAHKSFTTTFDGQGSHSREELGQFIRTLLPTTDGPAKDENGMAFPQVLTVVAQASAAQAPDGQPLGVPDSVPGSKAIALWQTVVLRIKPIRMGNADFTLLVGFRPSSARFLMSLLGAAERFQVQGYKRRVVSSGYFGKCPATVPSCKDLPDVVDLDTAWLFDSVTLRAEGGGLSGAAMTVLNQLAEDNHSFLRSNNLQSFEAPTGAAEVAATDNTREMKATAEPDPNGATGTQTITVTWREQRNAKGTYAASLAEWLKAERQDLVLHYGPTQQNSRK